MTYQPFYHVVVNQYHGAFAAVFAWAAVCTLLAQERGKPADQVGLNGQATLGEGRRTSPL
jgi:hypothetical protein